MFAPVLEFFGLKQKEKQENLPSDMAELTEAHSTETITEEKEEGQKVYEETLSRLKENLRGKGKRSIKYLEHYKESNEQNIEQIIAMYQFLSNLRSTDKKIVIASETLEENQNHTEVAVINLVKDLSFKYFLQPKPAKEGETQEEDNQNQCYILKNEIVLRGNGDADKLSKDSQGSYLEVSNLDDVFLKDPEKQRIFATYLNNISGNIVLYIRGTKKNLTELFLLMNTTPDFYFNCANEYSLKEFQDAIERAFENSDFQLEEGWEECIRLLLAKPSETNKVKTNSYYRTLYENLKKKALTDITQKKNKDGKIMIKNDYFGVKSSEEDFENLKSLKDLSKLIGMEEVKDSVKELIAYLEFNQKLKEMVGKSFPLNLHMMFTGDPGTGKTTIARIIANILFELGYISTNNLIEVDKKDLVSQWVGHTSIKTNEIIQKARGGVLFVDEAYSVADDKFGKDAIATLIKAMEDLKTELVVIFAGYQKEMEEFVESNPGMFSRIGKKIHFNNYTEEELLAIYETKLEDYQMNTVEEAKKELFKIVSEKRQEKNFGNGRFIDNLIQDLLGQHAVNTRGIRDRDTLLTLTKKDIPEKYLPKTSTENIPTISKVS